MAYDKEWTPPPIQLGHGATSGVSVFGKSAGNFYSFDGGNSADSWSGNISLINKGIPYDGSDLALKINYKMSASGGGSDTVFVNCNFFLSKDGDNNQTGVTALTQKVIDTSASVIDIRESVQLDTMTGVEGADSLELDFTRDSIAGSGDVSADDWEVTSIELLKV